ncbi:MAG: hypothetical protein LH609_06965 [Rudanella sp.]|nr:hypothetical protein [Rudanella sp.]
MKLINLLLYFIFTIVFLGNIGTLLPLAIDYFPENTLSEEAYKTFPGNLLTYYLSIFFVSLVDRIIHIIKKEDYKYKITEVLIFGLIVLVCLWLIYMAFSKIHQKQYDSALWYCLFAIILSYIVWWIANYKDEKMNPNNAIPKP